MTVEELCVVVSVSAQQALQGLDTVTNRLQAMGRQAHEMKPLEIGVNGAAMGEAGKAILELDGSLQGIARQANMAGVKLQNMGKIAATDETKKALTLDWDATAAQKTGAVAEIAIKSFGEAVKDTTKNVVKDMKKQEKGAFAIKDVITGVGSSFKSILTKGFVGAGIDFTETAVDRLAGTYRDLAAAIEAAQGAQKTSLAAMATNAAKNEKKIYAEELTKVYENRDRATNSIKDTSNMTTEKIAEYQKAIDECDKKLAESHALRDAFDKTLNEVITSAEKNGKNVNEHLANSLAALANMDATLPTGVNEGLRFVDEISKSILAVAGDPAISDAINQLTEITSEQVMQGITPKEGDMEAFTEGWQMLSGDSSPLMELLNTLAMKTADVTDTGETLLTSLIGLGEGFSMQGENGEKFTGSLEDVRYNLEGMAEIALKADSATNGYCNTIKQLEENAKDLGRCVNNTSAIKKYVKQWDDGSKALRNAKKGSKEAGYALEEMAKAAKGANVAFDGTEEGAEDVSKKFQILGSWVAEESGSIAAALATLQHELVNTESEMLLQGAAGLDISDASAKIAELEQQIASIVAYANANGIDLSSAGVGGAGDAAPRKGGGGGGGGGGRNKDTAEDAARAAEEARKEAIARDYDTLAHKRHMNELTLEQELTMLEKIRKKHRLNAVEIMSWEEKIYDLKKEIRERDSQSMDNMTDSVIDALTARYESMRDAEIERLDAGREAWEQWRDESVKAINDQIAALDKLADTEDREKKDAEELRKIAKLKQEIEFEQDDYNRAKLSQQLEAAIAARTDRLHKQDIEDQKKTLQEQIDQVEQKVEDELTALDKEQEGLEKIYEERLKSAAIRAEAEKLILNQSQEQILELLKGYAPEYDATGQTLGEKLLEGFQKKVGGIAEWFKGFNAQMVLAQEQMAAVAQQAAGTFYQQQGEREKEATGPTVVNQTVQFYEPVQTPSQVARRITQVNEELAVLLLA